MIRIEHLVKIFKSKKKDRCNAINDVSFVLPDTGMAFIIGKSGSGKTTLLSLIGTLDNITSGNIIVNDISLKDIKEDEASNYRNEMIGFIYQDYHLIDELNIYENIKISLDLKGNKNNKNSNYKELISNALTSVGLKGYESRFPKELSGGEKQRIAIARAIVKDPKIILADEPTGNLDSNTTIQILNLLKELSKDRLILIVSHDKNNAYLYSDLLITLSKGKVINILKRNPNIINKVSVIGDTLYLPSNKNINEVEEEFINSRLYKIRKIHQIKDEFIPYNYNKDINKENIDNNRINKKKDKKKLGFKNTIKLGFKFLKSKLLSTIIYSVILASLINILALSQLLSNYPKSEMIGNAIKKDDISTLVLRREKLIKLDEQSSFAPSIPFKDIEEFKKLPLKGNMYQGINWSYTGNYFDPVDLNRYNPSQSIILTNEEFISKTLYDNKEIEIIKNPKQDEAGFYLTDMMCDIMISRFNQVYKTYDDFFTSYLCEKTHKWRHGYVNGIIKTNYSTKFKDILKYYNSSFVLEGKKFDELETNNDFIKFCDEVKNLYLKKYTFDESFFDKVIHSDSWNWVFPSNVSIVNKDKKDDIQSYLIGLNKNFNDLKDNEIVVSYYTYKKLTGINLNSGDYIGNFKPVDVTLDYYGTDVRDKIIPIHQEKLKVVGANYSQPNNYVFTNRNTLTKLQKNEQYAVNLIFDNIDDLDLVLNKANEMHYYVDNEMTNMYSDVASLVSTFSDLFELVMIILLIGIILLLIYFALKTIKDDLEDIGILKSLGTRNTSLINIFSLKTLSLCIFTSIFYLLTSQPFIKLSNDILLKSINTFTSRTVLTNMEVINFKPLRLIINVLFIFIITLVAYFIQVIRLRKIKPINIIKAKE